MLDLEGEYISPSNMNTPVSDIEFAKILALSQQLAIIECIALAARCGVIYNPALANSLEHYELVETVMLEGDFGLFGQLLAQDGSEIKGL